MKAVHRFASRVVAWRYSGLVLLALASLALHFSIVSQPDDLMVDEVYYVNDARAVLDGTGEPRPEHPPLGQLLIAAGMATFGDNTFGWRVFPVVFGVAGLAFFYLICGRLGMTRRASVLTTSLLAFENMSFVQGGIAMLDVFSVAFMLAGFWLYLRRDYGPAAVAIGLSTLAKLTGALALPAIVLHWLLVRRDNPPHFAVSLALAPLVFVLLLPLLDYVMSGEWYDPLVRIRMILSVSSSITFAKYTNPYASHPWDWVLRPTVMPYYWEPQYVSAISFTVGALIIPVMVFMVLQARKGEPVGAFSLSWFAFTYLAWIPLGLITDRMTYVFYFYPSVGAVCLGLGLGLSKLLDLSRTQANPGRRRLMSATVWAYLALHIAVLIALTPLFSVWVPLSTSIPAGS